MTRKKKFVCFLHFHKQEPRYPPSALSDFSATLPQLCCRKKVLPLLGILAPPPPSPPPPPPVAPPNTTRNSQRSLRYEVANPGVASASRASVVVSYAKKPIIRHPFRHWARPVQVTRKGKLNWANVFCIGLKLYTYVVLPRKQIVHPRLVGCEVTRAHS